MSINKLHLCSIAPSGVGLSACDTGLVLRAAFAERGEEGADIEEVEIAVEVDVWPTELAEDEDGAFVEERCVEEGGGEDGAVLDFYVSSERDVTGSVWREDLVDELVGVGVKDINSAGFESEFFVS